MSNPSNPFNHRWEWVPLNPAPNPFSDPKADSAPVPVYARTYFTLCQYQNSLLLYAGFGDKTGRFSDLIVFDGTSKGWRLVNCKGELPKPVYLHSAAVLSNYMYIFGGNTGKDSNMFHRLNLDTYTWQNLGTLTGSPSARYGHASCALTELNQIYVVGGSYGNSQYSNESFSYNVQTSQWRRLADFPVASAYHTLVPYRGRILSIGGYNGSVFVQHVYEYVPEDNRWTIFSTSGDVPPASCGNAVSLHGDTIYVFGGYAQDGHCSSLYRLKLISRKWECIKGKNKPLSRAYLQSGILNHTYYIIGGFDGSQCVTDHRSLQLPVDEDFDVSVTPSQSINMAKLIATEPVHVQVEAALKHFGRRNGDVLDRSELTELFSNIARHSSNSSNSPSASSSSASQSPSYPFDTSRVGAIVDLGFPREHVLRVMSEMHRRGQDVRKFELVVDRCLNEPIVEPANQAANVNSFSNGNNGLSSPSHSNRDSGDVNTVAYRHFVRGIVSGETITVQAYEQLQNERQNRKISETVHYSILQELGISKEKFESMKRFKQGMNPSEKESECVVCLDQPKEHVILPCGHLCICQGCAHDLQQKPNGNCPLCSNRIHSIVKIFF